LVKSLKAKLKKALEAINKITAESQANEMFDADDADAAESSNIDATSTSTQRSTARLEQQTIDFFKIHSPQTCMKVKCVMESVLDLWREHNFDIEDHSDDLERVEYDRLLTEREDHGGNGSVSVFSDEFTELRAMIKAQI
jgi:hypothetical protein